MVESVQIFTVRLKTFAWTHRVLTPPPAPSSISVAKAGRIEIIGTSEIPPSSPLGSASYIAKPYEIYVKQRSRADVNSPL